MWARTLKSAPPAAAPWWQTFRSPPATAFRTRRATGRTARNGTIWSRSSALAEIVRDYVKKGSKLYVEGKIQTRSWDDKETGAKKYRTEIIVNDLSLLSGREDGGGYSRSSESRIVVQHGSAPTRCATMTYSQSAEISDDDIPF